ncbi:hypothetical protein BDP27DRAFT_1373082 [Rhodocollybia butyracea]|uniref:Uncharacterized protein n=1 Tax=Rhodocollybia butyracea TaxID=206335 RepID=A0A9P5P7U8_9AGAR|nr:hypothetical protein BDP27DRAFT_1373082 [Rhodocollybia butyracea]
MDNNTTYQLGITVLCVEICSPVSRHVCINLEAALQSSINEFMQCLLDATCTGKLSSTLAFEPATGTYVAEGASADSVDWILGLGRVVDKPFALRIWGCFIGAFITELNIGVRDVWVLEIAGLSFRVSGLGQRVDGSQLPGSNAFKQHATLVEEHLKAAAVTRYKDEVNDEDQQELGRTLKTININLQRFRV